MILVKVDIMVSCALKLLTRPPLRLADSQTRRRLCCRRLTSHLATPYGTLTLELQLASQGFAPSELYTGPWANVRCKLNPARMRARD